MDDGVKASEEDESMEEEKMLALKMSQARKKLRDRVNTLFRIDNRRWMSR